MSLMRLSSLALLLLVGLAGQANAHFPWLIVDTDGKPALFFGEAPTDRTYKLPVSIAKSKIQIVDGKGKTSDLASEVVESDKFVGIVGNKPAPKNSTLVCRATYGIYHGSRLNYYAAHYGGKIPAKADQSSAEKSPLDLYANLLKTDDGVQVQVLWKGKPLKAAKVTLFCKEGHEEGAAETNEKGVVAFTDKQVEPGLNAIMVGHTVKGESGKIDGEAYESAAHYLTLTFDDPQPSKEAKPKKDAGAKRTILKPLAEPIASFGAAVLGEYLYVFSGHSGVAHGFGRDGLSDHFRRIKFDDPKAAWEELAKHEAAQSTALVSDGKHLYRVGGLTFLNERSDEKTNFKSTTHFARYDVEKNEWTELAPLPNPRSSLDAAVLDGSIYVAGGWNLSGESSSNSTWHETILRFDLENPSAGWQSLEGPGYKTRALSVAAHQGKLYIIGGIQKRGITRKVCVYDPETKAWSAGPELHADSQTAGFATSSFGVGDKLYVTGGSGVLYRLNDDDSKWDVANNLVFPRMFLRLLPAGNDRLIAVGGTSRIGGRIATIELIDLAKQPKGFKTVEWSVDFGGRAKQSQSLIVDGGKLYAFGGNASREPHDFSKDAFVKEAFAFDIAHQTFEKLADAPQALQAAAVVAANQTSKHKKLVLLGGLGVDSEFDSLNTVYEFDPKEKVWTTSSLRLPDRRGMFNAVAHDDSVWMFGGSDVGSNGGLNESVLHWWADDSEIVPLPDVSIPTPRRSFGGAAIGDEYYVVGGLTEKVGIAETVDVFNFNDRTWRQVAAPKVPRIFPSLAALEGKLYLYGGFTKTDGHFQPAGSLEVYNVESDEWRTVAESIPGVSVGMTMLNVGDRLLFYGVDKKEAGKANFVLLIPEPLSAPKVVESAGFGRSRSSRDVTADAKIMMRKDANRDGKLVAAELGDRLKSLIENGDKNNDQQLDYSELKAVLLIEKETATEVEN